MHNLEDLLVGIDEDVGVIEGIKPVGDVGGAEEGDDRIGVRGNGGSERGGGIEGSFDNLGLLVIRKLCGGGGRYVDFLAELGRDFGGAAREGGDSVAFCEGVFDEDEAGGAGATEDEEVLGCH